MIPIWDIWVRLFHWSLAVSVLFQLYNGETGEGFYDWHKQVGELVLALIVFRILWGLWGSTNARLSALVQHPKSALSHFKTLLRRNVPQERGHNAAGGWAIIAMLLIIGTQALTGLFIADEEEFIEGSFYGALDSSVSDLLYTVHQNNAVLIQTIIVVHLVMIFLYWLVAKQNLVLPMISGKIRWLDNKSVPLIKYPSIWVGLATAVGVSVFFLWLLAD